MAISATQIATTNTLENFRQQFNNLQTDVNGLESGTLTFSSVSATTTSTSALNILEKLDDEYTTIVGSEDYCWEIRGDIKSLVCNIFIRVNKTVLVPTEVMFLDKRMKIRKTVILWFNFLIFTNLEIF